MNSVMVTASALLLALAVDRWLGEPGARLHPVVWMGHYLGQLAPHVAPPAGGRREGRRDLGHFWLGALAWTSGAALVLIATLALQWALWQLPGVLPAVLLGLALKPMLAWALLSREVLAVEAALGQSLAHGRDRLRWLVSRDVTHLSESQVRESAIESLAENLNDSVVAPIFWFVLLGLPGAALYRFANTADAMWGYPGVYQGRDWAWAGKWTARADDLLSWVPARLTAVLLALICGRGGFATLRQEARRTPSPNSGWPMAAMALALDVCLHKPGVYALNPAGRAPQAADTLRAAVYASKVVIALVSIACFAIFIVVFRML